MLPDFMMLPPEINSARMYAGPRSGSMWVAAAAWDGVAAELGAAASSFHSVVSGLTGGPWLGPTSVLMAMAAVPYVTWLSAASAQAEQVALQARLSAGAFEAAFAATVPPPVIAANRAQLAMLIATNILGQNTAAIAATEAQYAEMWAQDVAAMVGYDAGATAAGAQSTPFTAPPTSLAGAFAQEYLASTGPQLSSLTQPLGLSSLSNAMSRLGMLSTPAQLAMEPMNMVMGQLMTQIMTGANPLLGGVNGGVPTMGSALASTATPGLGGLSTAQPGVSLVSAATGRAGSIGPMSVPARWADAAAPATTASVPAGVAGAPSAGVSHLAPSVPRLPSLRSMGMPGRLIGAATPAIAAQRAGAVPRTAVD